MHDTHNTNGRRNSPTQAHYLVWARPRSIQELCKRLADEQRRTEPALANSLREARFDPDGWVAWEADAALNSAPERDLLERYFAEVQLEKVRAGDGWHSISALPKLWN